jgi:hypothetical protein
MQHYDQTRCVTDTELSHELGAAGIPRIGTADGEASPYGPLAAKGQRDGRLVGRSPPGWRRGPPQSR